MRTTAKDLHRMVALGTRAESAMARELLALRELVEAQDRLAETLSSNAHYFCGHSGRGLDGCDELVCIADANVVRARAKPSSRACHDRLP